MDLRLAARGDEQAFARIVREHQDRVVGHCQRMLGSRSAAEDVAQEVFVRLFRRAATLDPRGRLYTWLYRVATNLCLNRLRRRRIVRFVPLLRRDDASSELDPVDEGADPSRGYEARARWRATARRIGDLPENQRMVLILAKFEGLSYREIAEVLEISEGAVESRLFRAMRRLRRAAQEGDAPGVSGDGSSK